MKKTVALTLSLLLAALSLNLVACGDESEEESAANNHSHNNANNHENNNNNHENNINNQNNANNHSQNNTNNANNANNANNTNNSTNNHSHNNTADLPRAAYIFSTDPASNAWIVAVVETEPAARVVKNLRIEELSALTAPAEQGGNGEGPSWGDVIASPDGTRIFANATTADRVVVIDTINQSVETILEVGDRPLHIYNPNHNDEIWVHTDGTGAFNIIDALTLEVSSPLVAAGSNTGHGKLVYHEELGEQYYATNTNDPGIFPIDGATRTAGALIGLCSAPAPDDPNTPEDESQMMVGATHDKAYDPALGLVIVQCTAGNGFAFVNAETDEVVADLVPLAGSLAYPPDASYILSINRDLVQIWDTAAAGHTHTAFDATVEVVGGPSARGIDFAQTATGWDAWIPLSSGGTLTVLDLATRQSRAIEIGPLTSPDGVTLTRRGVLGGGYFFTYSDEGVIIVNTATSEVIKPGVFEGLPSRIVFADPNGAHEE